MENELKTLRHALIIQNHLLFILEMKQTATFELTVKFWVIYAIFYLCLELFLGVMPPVLYSAMICRILQFAFHNLIVFAIRHTENDFSFICLHR